MIRRLTAILLAFVSAFALALPAHEASDRVATESCCCGPDAPSTCGDRECAPQPCSASTTRSAAVDATEQRSSAAKPAASRARRWAIAFLTFVSPEKNPTAPVRVPAAPRLLTADSVALFQAHCSLLI